MKAWVEGGSLAIAKEYASERAEEAAEMCALENYAALNQDVITVYVQDGDKARRFDVEVALSAEAFEM